MPYVPRYEPGQVQPVSAPSDVMNTHATPASFGAGNAALIGQMGEDLTRVGQQGIVAMIQHKDGIDKASVLDAVTRAKNDALDGLQTSVYQKQGGDALDVSTSAAELMGKIGQTYRSQLKSPEQQALFDRAYNDFASDQHRSVRKYQFEQGQKYQADSLEGANNLAMRQAGEDPFNVEAMGGFLERIKRNTEAAARLHGASPEAASAAVQDVQWKTLDTVFKSLPSAKERLQFLETYKEHMNPAEYAANIEKTVKAAAEEEVTASTSAIINSGKSYPDQLEKVSAIPDPHLRALAFRQVQQAHELGAAKKAAERSALMSSEYNKIFGDPKNYLPSPDLSPEDRMRAMNFQDKVIKQQSGVPSQSDMNVYYELQQKSPQELQQLNLFDYQDKLTPGDLKHFMDRATSKSSSAQPFRAQSVASQVTQQLNMLPEFNYTRTDLSEDEKDANLKRRHLFLQAFDKKINEIPADKRDQATVQGVLEKLLLPVIPGHDPSLWNLWSSAPTVRAYEAMGDPTAAARLRPSGVPDTGTYDPASNKWVVPSQTGRTAVYNSQGQFEKFETPQTKPVEQPTPTPSVTPMKQAAGVYSMPPVQKNSVLMDLVKKAEGFTPVALADGQQHSVGWGTKAAYPGERISVEEAQTRLVNELTEAQNAVLKEVQAKGYNLSPAQITALTDFTFNAGIGAMSRIVRNSSTTSQLSYGIRTYRKDDNTMRKNPGLVDRYEVEADLFDHVIDEIPADIYKRRR